MVSQRLKSTRQKYVAYGRHLKLLWLAAPWIATALASATIISGVSGAAIVIASGYLLDSVLSSATRPFGFEVSFGIFALLSFATIVLGGLAQWLSTKLTASYLRLVYDLVAETGLAPDSLSNLEDPAFGERRAGLVASVQDWRFHDIAGATFNSWGTRIGSLTMLGVVISWQWWIAALGVVCYYIIGRLTDRWFATVFTEIGEASKTGFRKAHYYRDLLSDAASAGEVRIYGWKNWGLNLFANHWHAVAKALCRRRGKASGVMFVSSLGMFVVLSVCLLSLSMAIASGDISLGYAVAVVGSFAGFLAFGFTGDAQVNALRSREVVQRLFELRHDLGLPMFGPTSRSERSAAAYDADPNNGRRRVHLPLGLKISNLTFGYPDGEPLYRNLSLEIPAGQSTAIVGVNGIGKTTLIKLICGLYAPQAGKISLDGLTPRQARERVAVVFQDFVRYRRSLRDNIEIGAFGTALSESALETVLSQARGKELLARIGDWDAMLGKDFDGGTELSGGEWQRIALARAFAAMHTGAGLLILDEPTAALDVRAEKELFDDFLRFSSGMTTILVTHRLAAVRRTQRIVLIDRDGVVEDGSHEELMAQRGQYFEMFSIQAQRYSVTEPRQEFAASGESGK